MPEDDLFEVFKAYKNYADSDFADIKNCELAFKCPKRWGGLESTDDAGIKFCGSCEQHVYLAEDWQAVTLLAAAGRCVAYHPADGAQDFEVLGAFLPVDDEPDSTEN